jgi:hypothetical protein
VYWENAFTKSSWCCDWPCTYRLCNLCYWSQPNPHRTCNLRVNVEGQTTFEFGVGKWLFVSARTLRSACSDRASVRACGLATLRRFFHFLTNPGLSCSFT